MKYLINKIKQKKDKGFTIIETLVAITILMIAIAGPMTIAHRGLMASIYARDQVTASLLAQDAMEYLKNLRSRNVDCSVTGNIPPCGDFSGWLSDPDGIATKCTINNPCIIDTYGSGYVFRATSDVQYELFVPDNGIYVPNPISSATPSTTATPSSLAKSIFTRKFYVDTTTVSNSGDEATFVVLVNWANGTIENEVKLHAQMFNISL